MYAALANAQQRYKQQGVLTANPVELVVMLYDGCIKQVKIASMAISAGQIEKTNNSLQKAQLIIMELVNSLDLHYPIAQELLNLYDFLMNELTKVNVEKSADRIPGILGILEDLRDAWKTIAKEGTGAAMLVDEE